MSHTHVIANPLNIHLEAMQDLSMNIGGPNFMGPLDRDLFRHTGAEAFSYASMNRREVKIRGLVTLVYTLGCPKCFK